MTIARGFIAAAFASLLWVAIMYFGGGDSRQFIIGLWLGWLTADTTDTHKFAKEHME